MSLMGEQDLIVDFAADVGHLPGVVLHVPAESPLVTPKENNYSTEMCSGSEAGSYLSLTDFCITQL